MRKTSGLVLSDKKKLHYYDIMLRLLVAALIIEPVPEINSAVLIWCIKWLSLVSWTLFSSRCRILNDVILRKLFFCVSFCVSVGCKGVTDVHVDFEPSTSL